MIQAGSAGKSILAERYEVIREGGSIHGIELENTKAGS